MTNKEFVEKLLDVLNYKTVYMWGTFGSPITEGIIKEKTLQYPSWYTDARKKSLQGLIEKNYFAFDCVGLIKGILWGWNGDPTKYHGGAKYNSCRIPDVTADMLINKCNSSSDFLNILAGEVVWMNGHVGVYIGNGKVIESTPTWKNGVQITDCWNVKKTNGNGRIWVKHGKLPYITYEE